MIYRKIRNTKTTLSGTIPSPMILLLLLFFVSCEKEADWPLEEFSDPAIVVEAMLTNEFQLQQIQLSQPVATMNDTPLPVSGALIKVSSEQQSIVFSESDTNPGLYMSNEPFAAAVGRDYLLTIESDTLSLYAQTYMVPVFPFNSPSFHLRENRGLYQLNWSNPQYSPFEQAMYEADISWSHVPPYNHPDSVSQARILFFTLNTIDVSHIIFPQNTEEVLFPAGATAVISKYSLNDEYAAYLRALLSETQWQGSLFEAARDNLPGNISEGGLGYFSTCAVIRDTLLVE